MQTGIHSSDPAWAEAQPAAVTVGDVAEVAGLSVSTIYRVMNGSDSVSPKTAERIRETMRMLQFDERAASRGRPRGRRPVLRSSPKHHAEISEVRNARFVLLLSHRLDLDRMPFFATMLQALMECVRPSGTLTVMRTEHNDAELLPMLEQFRADGVLVVCSEDRAELKRLSTVGSAYPMVWMLGDDVSASPFTHVTADNIGAGRIAADHLLGQGEEMVWYIAREPTREIYYRRWVGFSMQTQRFGRVARPILIANDCEPSALHRMYGDDCVVLGSADELRSMPALGSGRHGLFISTDHVASQLTPYLGLLDESRSRFRVVCCDGVEAYLSLMTPRPASVSLQIEQIASAAIDELVQCVDSPDRTVREVLIRPSLTPGEMDRPA